MTPRLTGFSPLVRHMIQERAQFYCERCGCSILYTGFQHHHRRPRGAGGSRRPETNEAANGLALCFDCHEYVESHRSEALAAGWLISQHRKGITPCEIPVEMYDGTYLLDNEGNKYSIPNPHRETA